ncbi:MAG: GGDEF domain-containing protein, partial [Chloroflexota bacterium]|nr:GGDEF domain-containing protein [Chloroflexota bacterium]
MDDAVEGLGSAIWASNAWVMAFVDPDLRIAAASAQLEKLSRRALVGEPVVGIVSSGQREAFTGALAAVGPAWSEIWLGLVAESDALPVDYRLRLRRSGGGIVLVGEPALLEDSIVGDELLEANDDLVAEQRRLTIDRDRLDRLTTTDPLTGVLNRRGLEAKLAAIVARAGAHPVSLVFADLDHFKTINDTFGHPLGDVTLRFAADHLSAASRTRDLIGRFGGEEFVAVLPATDLAGAARWAERARSGLAATPVPALGRPVTASFGVAELLPDETGDELLARADAALYAAKGAGRNRVELSEGRAPAMTDRRADPTADPSPRLSDLLWASSGIGVAEFDADDRVSGANSALELLLGSNVVGRPVVEIVTPEQAAAMKAFVAALRGDWTRATFGLRVEGTDIPLDRAIWLRRGVLGLDMIVDVPADIVGPTGPPMLELVDDLVATQRELTTANRELQRALDDLRMADTELLGLRELIPICSWCRRIGVGGPTERAWV